MITRISPSVWKLSAASNIYLLDSGKKIIIDTGERGEHHLVEQFLGKVVDFDKVDIVIYTHLHYDHAGNFDLFKNAVHYASEEEIASFRKDPNGAVLNSHLAARLKEIGFNGLPERIEGLEVIKTPGHTAGSVCLWLEADRILFSGDTLFFKNNIGRTDLPTSVPEKMRESLVKLVSYNYKTLCPGHDY